MTSTWPFDDRRGNAAFKALVDKAVDNLASIGTAAAPVATAFFTTIGSAATKVTTAFITTIGSAAAPVTTAFITTLGSAATKVTTAFITTIGSATEKVTTGFFTALGTLAAPVTNLFAGKLRVEELQFTATNPWAGQVTLVAGEATVTTDKVQADSTIVLGAVGLTNAGHLGITDIALGTSFEISSSNASDVRVINWAIINPAD